MTDDWSPDYISDVSARTVEIVRNDIKINDKQIETEGAAGRPVDAFVTKGHQLSKELENKLRES